MGNKGQTTIFFSLIISVLLLFTLSALEVGRIYMSKVKIRAVVHSTCSSLMADYNSELFERYHLLFMDPTYGTGSEAALEEKAIDYLDCSLNGEKADGNGIYEFQISQLMLADKEGILYEDMALLKKQIADYEKSAGVLKNAEKLVDILKGKEVNVEGAASETEQNGVEMPSDSDGKPVEEVEVTDPRDTLKNMLTPGILSITLPEGVDIPKETLVFENAPSKQYEEEQEEERDNSFQNIGTLIRFLKNTAADDDAENNLKNRTAFVDYVSNHFSNGIRQREDSVHKCEIEYILKGKDSDYKNMQSVVNEIMWMRMPVNYAYLLSDEEKKSEALTVAAAICTATGTEGMIEVVKYLLLGCWAYGETICEMRTLLSGEKIPYIKTKETWTTDLKTLGGIAAVKSTGQGLSYENYLMLLLAKKKGDKLNSCYARMLDLIDVNIKKTDPDFSLVNCAGRLKIQGEISINSHFVKGKGSSLYSEFFEEEIGY